jgi:hypothetical protein
MDEKKAAEAVFFLGVTPPGQRHPPIMERSAIGNQRSP